MALDVLMVDDSPAIRRVLRRILQQAGLPIGEILEAGDGDEALEVLKSRKVALILSDVNMPERDGLELLAAVKADPALKEIPVIMMTTEETQAKMIEAVRLGAAGYVRKPFTVEEIREKIEGLT